MKLFIRFRKQNSRVYLFNSVWRAAIFACFDFLLPDREKADQVLLEGVEDPWRGSKLQLAAVASLSDVGLAYNESALSFGELGKPGRCIMKMIN